MDVVPVYLVVRKAGITDAQGEDLYIVFDVKLTRSAAEAVVFRNPGTEVMKMKADKATD
jgi:hypothetical protein